MQTSHDQEKLQSILTSLQVLKNDYDQVVYSDDLFNIDDEIGSILEMWADELNDHHIAICLYFDDDDLSDPPD